MAGAVPLVPKFQFTDPATGNPLAMGWLTVFLAGTSTLANTYSDEALTVPNTNPVHLDANGEAVLWSDPTKRYKWLLQARDPITGLPGVTVPGWPVDNIPGGQSGDLSAPGGSASIGFLQVGTGAVGRPLQGKLREVAVSGQDFGSVVVGGATDNRAVLQAALDSAVGGARSGAHEVVIYGDGDIGLAAPLVVPSNVRLVFDGDARMVPTVGSIFGLNLLGSAPSAYSALAADAGRGTNVLQLASTAAFAVGGDVFVRATTLLPITATAVSQTVSPVKSVGQWAKVVGKTATLLYLDIALEYDYLVAAAAEVGIGAMKRDVRVENLKWGRLGGATLGGRAINIAYARSLSIIDLIVENTRAIGGADNAAQHGINMVSAVDVTIERFAMRQIGYYGIGVDGASANVRITSGRVHAARHAVSLVNGDNYGEPLDVTIENVIAENSTLSGFDTHEYGDRTLFRNCVARNSNDDGFQVRSRGVTIEGGGAFKSFLDGLGAQDGATDLVVMAGFVADSNRRRGVTLEITARIQGSRLTRNGTGGVSGSGGMFCRGGEVINTQVSDNNGPGINFGNAGDAAAGLLPSRLRIEGSKIPHSAAQDLAVTIAGDDEYLTSYVSLNNCEMVGYSGGAIQKRKGTSTGGTLPAAPRMMNIETASGAAGSPSAGIAVLVAGTVTVPTTAVKNYAGSLGTTTALAPWRSQIQLTRVVAGGTTGALAIETITDGASFVIKSTSATDTSSVAWSLLS